MQEYVALILAAGAGTRLLPKTKTIPKCLLPVHGKPILQYQLEVLLQYEIQNVVIVLGHYGNKIKNFLSDSGYLKKLNISFVKNTDYLNTNSSYSLWLAKEQIQEGFIHINSDLIFDPKIVEDLLNCHFENRVVVDTQRHDEDMARAVFDGKRIIEMGRSPHISKYDAVVVGPFCFSSSATQKIIAEIDIRVSSGDKNGWCYLDFADFISQNKFELYYVETRNNFWYEIDTEEDYSTVCQTQSALFNQSDFCI
jgi:L-glutamine-phosphate cytidylyltransferase